jgi:hypothetical protein
VPRPSGRHPTTGVSLNETYLGLSQAHSGGQLHSGEKISRQTLHSWKTLQSYLMFPVRQCHTIGARKLDNILGAATSRDPEERVELVEGPTTV